ncbi:MAG: hypothetical protein QM529_01540 [Hydrotalea sp.]|nr:hypothetical protein [Hydrotalea sp.]
MKIRIILLAATAVGFAGCGTKLDYILTSSRDNAVATCKLAGMTSVQADSSAKLTWARGISTGGGQGGVQVDCAKLLARQAK